MATREYYREWNACNHGIGNFKEDIKSLDRARKYLMKFNKGGN